MNSSGSRHGRRLDDLEPNGRHGDPVPDRRRRPGAGEFDLNCVGKNYSFAQARKKFDMADQDQVIDGAGVGNHQPHGL